MIKDSDSNEYIRDPNFDPQRWKKLISTYKQMKAINVEWLTDFRMPEESRKENIKKLQEIVDFVYGLRPENPVVHSFKVHINLDSVVPLDEHGNDLTLPIKANLYRTIPKQRKEKS